MNARIQIDRVVLVSDEAFTSKKGKALRMVQMVSPGASGLIKAFVDLAKPPAQTPPPGVPFSITSDCFLGMTGDFVLQVNEKTVFKVL